MRSSSSMKHALILCSGGIDSVTTAYFAQKKKYASHTLMFCAYGQLQEAHERRAVKYHARKLKANYVEIALPALAHLSHKQRTSPKIHQKKMKDTKHEGKQWFVPARNTLLIVHALAYIESHYQGQDKVDLFLGFKNEGREPFPDATRDYTKKMQALIRQASTHKVTLKTPLITKDKEDIIKKGTKLALNYATTWSCYQPRQNKHCGLCLACRLRKAGFKWANVADPTSYAQ